MGENVKLYRDSEIDDDVIKMINDIVIKSVYADKIKNFYYGSHTKLPEVDVNHSNYIYIGTNWFLQCRVSNDEIDILDWVSISDDDNKIQMVTEMLTVFRNILSNSDDRVIYARMRHDTGFQFYYRLFARDYLEELDHKILLDSAEDNSLMMAVIDRYLMHLARKSNSFDEFLTSIDRDKYLLLKYRNYILHNIKFMVSDKFKKEYRQVKKLG